MRGPINWNPQANDWRATAIFWTLFLLFPFIVAAGLWTVHSAYMWLWGNERQAAAEAREEAERRIAQAEAKAEFEDCIEDHVARMEAGWYGDEYLAMSFKERQISADLMCIEERDPGPEPYVWEP